MITNIRILICAVVLSAAAAGVSAQESVEKKNEKQKGVMPDISLIADFSGVYRNIDAHDYGSLEMPGLTHSAAEGASHGHSHAGMHSKPGFNFNYAELVMSSSVDPYFDMFAAFHLTEESFEIEEAFLVTTALPGGLQLKAGKFLSSFGRHNSQHAHYWNFADQPLVYNAVFGGHGLIEKGIQAAYTFPLPFYLAAGAEVLQGENENSFGTEGFQNENPGVKVDDAAYPGLYTMFIKGSNDIGKLTLLYGISGAYGRTRVDHGISSESPAAGDHGVDADSVVSGADFTAKYFFDSYTYISFQIEGLYRYISGDHYFYDGSPLVIKREIKKKQGGFYAQAVIKPLPQWRFGARYDMIPYNSVKLNGADTHQPENLFKASCMADYAPSEFSYLRIQYNFDRSKFIEESRKTNHEIILQLNAAIGSHGAHTF